MSRQKREMSIVLLRPIDGSYFSPTERVDEKLKSCLNVFACRSSGTWTLTLLYIPPAVIDTGLKKKVPTSSKFHLLGPRHWSLQRREYHKTSQGRLQLHLPEKFSATAIGSQWLFFSMNSAVQPEKSWLLGKRKKSPYVKILLKLKDWNTHFHWRKTKREKRRLKL